MTDPVSISLAVITFSQFLKTIIELGQQIKSSIDKLGRNKKRLHDLTDDVLHGLSDLENFYQGRENVLDGCAELLTALDGLRTEMSRVLENCLRTCPEVNKGGPMAIAGAEFKAWKKRDDIEADIIRLKERVQACYMRFTTIASARIEHTSTQIEHMSTRIEHTSNRIEHALLILDNEQRVRLSRMENMVSRLVDKQIDFRRAGEFKSLSSTNYGDIPNQYLRLQIREIIDAVEKFAASGPFAVEEPEGVHLLPFTGSTIPQACDPPTQHREVVAQALRILRLLQDDQKTLPIQTGAFNMLNLSGSLFDLGMVQDADITRTWAAKIYRTLVRGNAKSPFLPHLGVALFNLVGYRHSIYDDNRALAASQECVAVCRILNDPPTCHNATEKLAEALGNHARALNHVDRFDDGLAAAQESVMILRKLISDNVETAARTYGKPGSKLQAEQWPAKDDQVPNLDAAEAETRCPTVIDNFTMLRYKLGVALRCLSVCLSHTGRTSDACDAVKEALAIFRFISKSYPGTFDEPLAGVLCEASDHLMMMHRPLEALPLMEKAVVAYRVFAQKRPNIFPVSLILALCKFAILLYKTGRHDDALTAGDEAVGLFRSLVGDRPDCLLHLPSAFYGVYSYLKEVEHHEEALVISTDAVDAYRMLIRDSPSLTPSFAYMLRLLALQLRDGRRPEDALVVSKEVVDAYRSLAKDGPVVYTSKLVLALVTLAHCYCTIQQYSEGIEVAREAVELYCNLSQGQPDFQGKFFVALKELWITLGEASRLEDGIEFFAEVITVYRARAVHGPADFSRRLAEILSFHAHNLYRNYRYHDGILADEEAVNLYRSLKSSDSACNFVDTANDFAIGLYEVGQVEQAIGVCQEAITICRDIIGDHPQLSPTLISLQASLSDCFRSRGQFDEALRSNEEAVSLSRNVPAGDPSDLACELRELSISLLNAGQLQVALRASEEAVEICRGLPQSQDASSGLAYALDSLSSCLAGADREEEALEAAQEAVTLYRQITPNYRLRTGCLDYNVADARYNFAARLAAAGRPAEALANTRDAANMYRTVVTTRAVHLPKFATVLHSLSVRLWEAGCQDEAINAWKEEVTIRQHLASTNSDLIPMLHHALCELPARLSQVKPEVSTSTTTAE